MDLDSPYVGVDVSLPHIDINVNLPLNGDLPNVKVSSHVDDILGWDLDVETNYPLDGQPTTSIDVSNPKLGVSVGLDFISEDFVGGNIGFVPHNPLFPTHGLEDIKSAADWKFTFKWDIFNL